MLTRNCEIKIRLTSKELGKLNQNVSATTMNREQYIRSLINGFSPKEAPPADYYKLICAVRKVGANVNQLLKVANSIGLLDVPKIRSALEELRKTEQMLWDTFAPEKV